jgi:hypothetical protein
MDGWMDSYPAVHEPEVEYAIQKKKKKRANKWLSGGNKSLMSP